MLMDAGLAPQFWGEALSAATYIINRQPSRPIGMDTPYERFYNRPSTMDYIRIFGCECEVLILPKVKKLAEKTKSCILLGYSELKKAYRLWDPKERKIIFSRDVTFKEGKAKDTPLEIDLEEGTDKSEDTEDSKSEGGTSSETSVESNESDDSGGADSGPGDENGQIRDDEAQRPEAQGQDQQLDDPRVLRRSGREPQPRQNWWIASNQASAGEPSIESPTMDEDHRASQYDYLINLAEADISVPQTYEQAVNGTESDHWKAAMDSEMNSIYANQTFRPEVLPRNRKAVGCKWVFALKYAPDGTGLKYKARLVAQGCSQIFGLDYDKTYSPVARAATSRIFFTLVVKRNLHTIQADVVTAYLNGDMKEELYMKPPCGYEFPDGKVCRILKSLYGFKQSALNWREKLDKAVQDLGFKAADADPCIYTNGKGAILITYVDDIGIAAETRSEAREIYDRLKEVFKLEDRGDFSLSTWLGCRVTRRKNEIVLDQEIYVDKALKTFGLEDLPGVRTPMTSDYRHGPRDETEIKTNQPYLQAVGTLLYLATSTRPDISFTISSLASYCSDPAERHWDMVIRLFRYVKATKRWGIKLSPTNDKAIESFLDANYAGDTHTRKSVSGTLIKCYGSPVIWISRKQKSVTRSTLEAEYVASSQSTQQMLYVRLVLTQLGEQVGRVPLYIDNTSTIASIVNGAITERTKHIDVAYKIARDMEAEKIIETKYLRSEKMPADILTKGLTGDRMMDLMELIGMLDRKRWIGDGYDGVVTEDEDTGARMTDEREC